MTLLHLMISLSMAVGLVSAGYGGRGVIPSAADLSPSDAAGTAAGLPVGGPAVPTGGAGTWIPSKGVRPRPRPIVFPDAGGVIDPGFAPKPWITPGWNPGARPVGGGGAVGPGSVAIGPGGRPIGGGYYGGTYNVGRPSYVNKPVGGHVGPAGAAGGIGGLEPIGGVGGEGVGLQPVSGGFGEKPISGISGKPFAGVGGAGGKPITGFGGVSGTPVLEPVGIPVKPIDEAVIGGIPSHGAVGGGVAHGGSVEYDRVFSGGGVVGKPAVSPIGTEVGLGSIEGGGVGVGAPDVGGFVGGPVVGPSGSEVYKEGSLKGGTGTGVVGVTGLAGGGGYGDGFGVKPDLSPIGDVGIGGIGHGGSFGVKPGVVPIEGGPVSIKPGVVDVGGGGIGKIPHDEVGVGPLEGAYGGHDGSVPIGGGGSYKVPADEGALSPVGLGGINGGAATDELGVVPFDGGLTGAKPGKVPITGSLDGEKVLLGGTFGEGSVPGPIASKPSLKPIGATYGTYGGGTGLGPVAGKPYFDPNFQEGIKGVGPTTGGSPVIGPTYTGGIDGIKISGGDKAVLVPGGGVITDVVEPFDGGVYGGGTGLKPSGGASVIPGGGLEGVGLAGGHGFHSGGTGLAPVGSAGAVDTDFGIIPVASGSSGVVPIGGGVVDGTVHGGGAVSGLGPVYDKETGIVGEGDVPVVVQPGVKPIGGAVKPGFAPVEDLQPGTSFAGGSVGGSHHQTPPFGTGGHKPFLPATGDRAVGEVYPELSAGPVDGAGSVTGGAGVGGGVVPPAKPVGGYYGSGAWYNRPYKPPRGYGR